MEHEVMFKNIMEHYLEGGPKTAEEILEHMHTLNTWGPDYPMSKLEQMLQIKLREEFLYSKKRGNEVVYGLVVTVLSV